MEASDQRIPGSHALHPGQRDCVGIKFSIPAGWPSVVRGCPQHGSPAAGKAMNFGGGGGDVWPAGSVAPQVLRVGMPAVAGSDGLGVEDYASAAKTSGSITVGQTMRHR